MRLVRETTGAVVLEKDGVVVGRLLSVRRLGHGQVCVTVTVPSG